MSSTVSLCSTRQACRLCRRRKVKVSCVGLSNADSGFSPRKTKDSLTGESYRYCKCDGMSPCRNCHTAKATCQYSIPKKRGPKPAQCQDIRPQEPLGLTSPATDECTGAPVSPAPFAATTGRSNRAYSSPAPDNRPFNTIPASAPFAPPESQTRAAVRVHLDLLAGLLVAAPSDSPASIANQCILLYTQYVFGTVPMCHEAALRATVDRFFFISPSRRDDRDVDNGPLECFAADNERERVEVLRNLTLLTALCAAVTYVLPESLLPNKQLTAPLFLRTSRETLRIYEDYDLEYPNSSSLSIRLFLSSAVQVATGTHGVAFHIMSEAGLIAMRMRLYDEASLQGLDHVEESLLRNAFWQLYVCDKTALVMKGRPVTIDEALFQTKLTLKTHSQTTVPLFEYQRDSNAAEIQERLVEGFHVIRRLWTMAAWVIRAMESSSGGPLDPLSGRGACHESIAQLSQAYFETITLTSNHPAWARSPEESPRDSSLEPGHHQHQFSMLQRQRTSYLITLHCVKLFVLNAAIQCNMAEVMGLSNEPLALAMKHIELAQDFLHVLESVPFLHLQAEGEHCVSRSKGG